VMQRVAQAIHRLLELHRGRDIIAVAHGGTIRAALGLALGLEPEACLAFTMENCSVTRIDHIDGPGMGHGWRVVTVNRPPEVRLGRHGDPAQGSLAALAGRGAS